MSQAINLNAFLSALNDLERKNLPFAEATALNNTAFAAKARLIKEMPERFDLRSQRALRGFRVEKANKKQGIIQAKVFHLDAWMAIHEFGGEKTSNSGKSMGVPSTVTQDQGRAPSGKIRSKWWPRNLAKSPGFSDPSVAGRMGGRGHKGKGLPLPFLMVGKGGSRTIVRRTARGSSGATGARDGSGRWDLIELYYLKKEVRVSPRWDFEKTVLSVARSELAANMVAAMERAVKSSHK